MSVSAPKRSRTGILLSLIAVLALAVIALVDIPQQGEPYSPTSTASTGTRKASHSQAATSRSLRLSLSPPRRGRPRERRARRASVRR